MKYYIIAGEVSGDLHGANLVKELKKNDPAAEISCFGGDLMQREGANVRKHVRDLAFMGIIEVLMNIRTIKKNFSFCKNDILKFNPDVIIFIDYPGFNLKMAKFAKEKGYKTIYYISPKIWAWKTSRIKFIKNYVDLLLSILPFENDFYKKHGYTITYVGNPLMDAISTFKNQNQGNPSFLTVQDISDHPIVAVLPGSRKQEVEKILPEMMQVADKFPGYLFLVAGVSFLSPYIYEKHTSKRKNVRLIFDRTYDILSHSKAAIVASGTATLETALLNVPQVVCYKINSLTYRIGKLFFYLQYFSLVNLIMNKEVVKELLQDNLSMDIGKELDNLLNNRDYREKMLSEYSVLREKVGPAGASGKAAASIKEFLS